MATHPSVLAWRIPGMEEPVGLPSMVTQSPTRLKRLSSSSKFTGKSFDSPSLGDMPVTETDHVALEKDYYDWSGLIHLCLGGGP